MSLFSYRINNLDKGTGDIQDLLTLHRQAPTLYAWMFNFQRPNRLMFVLL
jgi:hypothetical protein